MKDKRFEITKISIDWDARFIEYKIKNISEETTVFLGLNAFAFDEEGNEGTMIPGDRKELLIKLKPGEETETIRLEEAYGEITWKTIIIENYGYKRSINSENSNVTHFLFAFEHEGDKTVTITDKAKVTEMCENMLW